MAWRFNRRVRIAPGISLNIGKTGISTTIGRRGASITIGKRGTYLNTGIPGSGLSYRTRLDGGSRGKSYPTEPPEDHWNEQISRSLASKTAPPAIPGNSPQPAAPKRNIPFGQEPLPTVDLPSLSSAGLADVQKQIRQWDQDRRELTADLAKARGELQAKGHMLHWLRYFIVGFIPFISAPLRNRIAELEEDIVAITEALENLHQDIEVQLDDDQQVQYNLLCQAFEAAQYCHAIWDQISEPENWRKNDAFLAFKSQTRDQIKLKLELPDQLACNVPVWHLPNTNGPGLYVFPSFLLVYDKHTKEVAALDMRQVNVRFEAAEELIIGKAPADSKLGGVRYPHVRVNGEPDRRFSDNAPHTEITYGKLWISHPAGMNECYVFSNMELALRLGTAWTNYQQQLAKLPNVELEQLRPPEQGS